MKKSLERDTRNFYGREEELQVLQHWLEKGCKIITIYGKSGIGKTSLVAKVVESVKNEFEMVSWINLHDQFSVHKLVGEISKFLSNGQDHYQMGEMLDPISQLIQQLQKYRSLLILDNWDTIQDEDNKLHYREMLKQMVEFYHLGCLLIISEEKPVDLDLWEGDLVRSLLVSGSAEVATAILEEKGLSEPQLFAELIRRYDANPHILKKIATKIKDLYAGSIHEFLSQQTFLEIVIPKDAEDVLHKKIENLSNTERKILIVIAFNDQYVCHENLQEIHRDLYTSDINYALESLKRKHLITPIIQKGKIFWTVGLMEKKFIIRRFEHRLNQIVMTEKTPLAQPPVPAPVIAEINQDNRPTNFVTFLENEDILPSMSRWAKLGGLLLAGSVGLVIALSAVIPYNFVIKANAQVRPAGELSVVETGIEGVVKEILVRENDSVKKDQILVMLDNPKLKTKKQQLTNEINQLLLQETQIISQIQQQDIRISAEKQRMDSNANSLQEELRNQKQKYIENGQTRQAQVSEAEANLNQTKKNLLKAESELNSFKTELKEAELTLKKAQEKSKRYQDVGIALSKDLLEQSNIEVLQRQATKEKAQTALASHYQQINSLKETVKVAQAKLQGVLALKSSQSDIEITKKRIEEQQATKISTIATFNKERDDLRQRQTQIKSSIASSRHELAQINKDLQKMLIKAPTDGIINSKTLRNSGQSVHAGEKLFTLVPHDAPLVIKASVANQDKNYLQLNQDVHMRVQACSYTDYGTLRGKVIQISPDTENVVNQGADTAATSVGQINAPAPYLVIIQPKTDVLVQEKNKCSITPGMQGSVDIIARETTMFKFILTKARLSADF